jgi:SPP1 family predicted phage head-tail adaptor
MRAGKLRDLVTLQSPVGTRDEVGQRTASWQSQGEVWADCQNLRGREYFAAAQVQQETSVKVQIRRRDDVQPDWRLVWEGRNYDVVSAVRVGTTMTELLVLQGVKDGR